MIAAGRDSSLGPVPGSNFPEGLPGRFSRTRSAERAFYVNYLIRRTSRWQAYHAGIGHRDCHKMRFNSGRALRKSGRVQGWSPTTSPECPKCKGLNHRTEVDYEHGRFQLLCIY